MNNETNRQIVIKLQNVSAKYGTHILIDQQNLLIGQGDRIAIIGESGQGKTTAIDIIRGHRSPTSGQVSILGRPINYGSRAQSELWSAMPLVSQEDSSGKTIPSYLTALENVLLVARLHGETRKHARILAENVLARVGLNHRMHAKPGNLSGGERQRVALARALVVNSPIILADEPTAALDPRTSRDILQCITDSGRTLVMVTHDAILVAPYVDQMLLLHEGVFHNVTDIVQQNPASLLNIHRYSQLLEKPKPQHETIQHRIRQPIKKVSILN